MQGPVHLRGDQADHGGDRQRRTVQTEERPPQQPAEHGGDADQHERLDLDPPGVDAHQPRARLVVADQEHMRAEPGAVEQQPFDDQDADHP